MKKTLLILSLTLSLMTIPAGVWAAHDVEMVEPETKDIVISQQNDLLRIVGANGLDVKIYNLAGVCVSAFKVEGNDRSYNLNLRKGCYIVKVGAVARKIFVK